MKIHKTSAHSTFLHAFTKKPLVLQIQGHTGSLYFRKYNPVYAFLLAALERLRPRFYEIFIVISERTAEKLSLPRRKNIAVISNGMSPELLMARPGRNPISSI
jgi:hypothetical protein